MTSHRILVVDDQPDAAQIACTLLTLLGHACAHATTGTEALDLAARFQPEIAIVDIGLPDLSGYEVARRLRQWAGPRRLYLVALTGWGAPRDRERAFAAGFDCHVVKPADASILRDIIARAERAGITAEQDHRA